MGRRTEVFELNSDTYRITQLGAEEGSELYDAILAAVGPKITPHLQRLAELSLDSADDGQLQTQLGGVVLEVLATVPRELKRQWRKSFTRTTEIQAGQVWLNMHDAKLFDEHFAGRYGAMTAWELACLRHNFLDFLPSAPGQSSSTSGEPTSHQTRQ